MSPLLQSWTALGIAILAEVAGSSFLMKSQQFTKLLPSLATIVLYVIAFYGLSLALRHIPLGVAYGIWAGVGIVLTAIIGLVLFHQALDAAALVGIGFIVVGVLIINLFSQTAAH